MKLSEKEKQAQQLIVKEVCKALDLVQKHIEEIAKKWDATSIPLNLVQTTISIFKKSYKEGADRTGNATTEEKK
jgi:hypothetical protein